MILTETYPRPDANNLAETVEYGLGHIETTLLLVGVVGVLIVGVYVKGVVDRRKEDRE